MLRISTFQVGPLGEQVHKHRSRVKADVRTPETGRLRNARATYAVSPYNVLG